MSFRFNCYCGVLHWMKAISGIHMYCTFKEAPLNTQNIIYIYRITDSKSVRIYKLWNKQTLVSMKIVSLCIYVDSLCLIFSLPFFIITEYPHITEKKEDEKNRLLSFIIYISVSVFLFIACAVFFFLNLDCIDSL